MKIWLSHWLVNLWLLRRINWVCLLVVHWSVFCAWFSKLRYAFFLISVIAVQGDIFVREPPGFSPDRSTGYRQAFNGFSPRKEKGSAVWFLLTVYYVGLLSAVYFTLSSKLFCTVALFIEHLLKLWYSHYNFNISR